MNHHFPPTSGKHVIVFDNKTTLSETVAQHFINKTMAILQNRHEAHIVLTGGTMGIAVLAAINASPERDSIDWAHIHFWWGDERWLPHNHPDRNDYQAHEAFLNHVTIPTDNIHHFPYQEENLTLDDAATQYAHQLAEHANPGELAPHFDLTFLGVGPDGHIASLFPSRTEICETEASVLPIRNAPKPPPERLSLTRPILNSSHDVWLVVAGHDKAEALTFATTSINITHTPAAGITGQKSTIFFADRNAAISLPADRVTFAT